MRTLALTIALSVVLVVPALDADHPNIVFIMSDDHAVVKTCSPADLKVGSTGTKLLRPTTDN